MGVCAAPPTLPAVTQAGLAGWRLFIEPGVALFHQPFELVILLIDAVGDPFLVEFARGGRGLFDQLPDVVLKDRDPIVEFRQ